MAVGLTPTPLYAQKASNDEPVILGVEDSWPPFALSNGSGISAEIVTAAYETMGRRVELRVLPYARVLREVESGALHGGFNVTRQASTQGRFLFGERPILTVQGSFYFPVSSDIDVRVHGDIPDDSHVGLIIGYEYGDQYEAHRSRFKEIRVSSQRQIIKMLLAHRLDMAIMFDEVARYTLVDMGLADVAIRKGERNHTSDIYVAFSKSRADSESLALTLDKGLEKITMSGLYSQIIEGVGPERQR
tara:strand:- start:7240 stop:7977 length:738 start_codon:yes stop_codon:yes gene_type:complete